ncbi:MAG: PKD domain-containing protein [Ferruginibacter sp.]
MIFTLFILPGRRLLIVLVLTIGAFFSNDVQAQYANVPVTGFNADVVADGTSNTDATSSTTIDVDGTGYVFVNAAYYPSAAGTACSGNGFPAPTITSTTNTGITYTLQAASGNNDLRLAAAASGDLTLTTPVTASNLFLVCLGGSGAAGFTTQVNFSDGTSETISSSAPDWCSGASIFRLSAAQYYRIQRTSTSCNGALCQYLYEVPVSISPSNYLKIINSVTLTNTSAAILNIFALGKRDAFNPGEHYTVNGNATQDDCHTYTLTNPQLSQSGSVWNNNKIDLTQPFDFLFDVYLGTDDAGADGIAFVLQPISTSVGGLGNGLGFGGVSPSVGVTLDTYQNSMPDSDPFYDHIAIQRNGDLDHLSTNNLAGPVQIINGNDNAEDGQWHKLRVQWNATTKTLDAYVDGSLRVTHTEDFVVTTFSNDPMVYWGFTGSTGGLFNLQRFRTTLEPHWHFAANQTFCVNQPVSFFDSTIAFSNVTKIIWNFGDGSNLDSVNINPVHTYTTAGTYTVTQTVRGADGCEETLTQTVTIGGKPLPAFSISDSCVSSNIQFTDITPGTITNWYWNLADAGPAPTIQNPVTSYATAGVRVIKFFVISQQGCRSDTLVKPITIYAGPTAAFTFTDSVCLGSATSFFDNSTSSASAISSWSWTYDDSAFAAHVQNPTHIFTTAGIHSVTLTASNSGSGSCATASVIHQVFVTDKPRAGIRVIFPCEAQQVQLLDSSYTTDGIAITSWWWDLGNGQFSNLQNPTVTYTTPGPKTIHLVVYNSMGCKSDTLTRIINVSPKPVAAFTISDSCVSNNIQFTDITPGTISSWYWNLANGGPASTLQNPATGYATAGIKIIKFVVTSQAGCQSDTLTKPITILERPTVDFSFTDSVCLGSATSFTDHSSLPGGAVNSWSWIYDDSAFTTHVQNPAHTFNTAGTHSVTLTASGTSTNACPASISIQVFVADKPRAGIKAIIPCEQQQVQLLDSSYTTDGLAITSWWWDLGNGQYSNQQNPTVSYTTPGPKTIHHVVYNSRGCKSDTLTTVITVADIPVPNFNHTSPLCSNNNIQFTDLSTVQTNSVNQWLWIYNGTVFATTQQTSLDFSAGTQQVGLSVTSNYGCKSDTIYQSFTMTIRPKIAMQFSDNCKFTPIAFSSEETPTVIGINEWHWNLGDGQVASANNFSHIYTANGLYDISLFAISSEGCSSDTLTGMIHVYGTDAYAGNDIIAAVLQPVQLSASGGVSYEWTPSQGLSATNVANPVVTVDHDMTYYLRAYTPEGCESFDTINIKVYNGPEIYVPTAFTPNGDGLNDVLLPKYVGLKYLTDFSIYNRYGQKIFSTSDQLKGWDGSFKGAKQDTQTFVWVITAEDFRGKPLFRKGTVMIIR